MGSSRFSSLGALAVLASLSLVAGCKKADANANPAQITSAAPPITVKTAKAVEAPMPELLTVTGTLRASQESEVAADASGKVTATLVERGQAVKQGQVLVVLDARSAALSANVASANSELAKAQLEQAQKECGRVDALFKSGAISQAEYDRTKSQCQTTEWSARAAQAQQQTVQKMVGDAIIKAPFSGVIGERFVNVGQYVAPSTKVVSLYTPDPLRLELTVPEQNIGALKQDMPVSFTVASYADRTFTGTVKFISPNVRPTTRDLVIEALCPNADNALRPGMFAVGKLAVGEKKLPAIPKVAVVGDPTAPHVYVVADKRIQERVVQVGAEKEDQVAVVAGLKAGESVVLSPGPDVKDGAAVAGE